MQLAPLKVLKDCHVPETEVVVDQSGLLPERLDPESPLPLIHILPLDVQPVLYFEAAAEIREVSRQKELGAEADSLLLFGDLFPLCLDLFKLGPRHDQLLTRVSLLSARFTVYLLLHDVGDSLGLFNLLGCHCS